MTTSSPDGNAHEPPRRLVRAEQVLAHRTRRVAVALEGSQDPHNVDAVLRTAEALGIQDCHFVRPRGRAAIAVRRATSVSPGVTQGAHRWLSLVRHESIEQAVDALRADGRTVWAADPSPDAEPLTSLADEGGRIAVLFGNETAGLSSRAREIADRRFRIDLVGFSGSLNLSVAAAITLWELRRLDVGSMTPGDLAPDEAAELRRDWYRALLSRRSDPDAALATWLERQDDVADAARSLDGRLPPAARGRPADEGAGG